MKVSLKDVFFGQFWLRTVSLDVVSHALSHGLLFNESGFGFCPETLVFLNF
jgi:hypothetical protein